MKNGEIYYIDFKGNRGSEINMVFCIPLTSPKEKHFKNIEAFNSRNHNELKYQNLIYIDKTDSIALLDQIRTISTQRLIKSYNVTLDISHINLIIIKVNKFIKNIMKE